MNRRASDRRIDRAFTGLMMVAARLLPGAAPFVDRKELKQAIAGARASDDLSRWPPACLELLQACESIADGEMDALRNGEIGKASSCEWPAPAGFAAWQARADIGEAQA